MPVRPRGRRDRAVVDFEASRTTFVKRARIVGIAEGDIDSRLRYIRPEDNWDDPAAEDFADALGELKPALVVFDGVTEALELAGLDMNKATDVARFQNALVRPALNVGAATVEIDHTGKDAGRGAVGSQHKRAGLDGAQVTFKGARPAGEGGHSTVELVITKDREGEIRGRLADSKTIGTFHIDTSGDVTAAYIAAPSSAEAFDRFDAIMEDVSAFLERQPEPVSQRAVERNVSANSADVRNALHTLVDRGHVERFDGPRGSKMHRSARPYRRPGLATASASTPKGG